MNPITFLSLFFGLIAGPYRIELAAEPSVAAIEIVIDGRAVSELHGPPWSTEVDFGPLAPHEIVARARGAGGREIASLRERVNVARSPAQVDIAVERAAAEAPGIARVAWSHLAGERPARVDLSLDGRPLTLDEEFRAVLPPLDTGAVHLLTAAVEFPSGPTVRRDLAFGGAFGGEAAAELTGVPVSIDGELPSAEQLAGRFTADGAPLEVVAVDRGAAELIVVRSPSLEVARERLGWRGRGDLRLARLEEGANVRLLFPFAERFEARSEISDLFEITPPLPVGSLPQAIQTIAPLVAAASKGVAVTRPRLADAVAVAGLEAARGSHRRAVLLVLSGRERDGSRFTAAEVRRFLAAIHVPLFVWTLERPDPELAAAWAPVVDAAYAPKVALGVEAIRRELSSQAIALVHGAHLPQTIRVAAAGGGIRLAGQPDPDRMGSRKGKGGED